MLKESLTIITITQLSVVITMDFGLILERGAFVSSHGLGRHCCWFIEMIVMVIKSYFTF